MAAPITGKEIAAEVLRGPVRIRTLTTLRWLAVAGQTAAILVVHFALGFPTSSRAISRSSTRTARCCATRT
jgi:hypothetical protein